jgi:hypothetical protein
VRFVITIVAFDEEPWTFYSGDLEPGEIGSIVVAISKRMKDEPPGWSVHITHVLERNP